jgi:hypothetical protein
MDIYVNKRKVAESADVRILIAETLHLNYNMAEEPVSGTRT